jgi:hypothetical protein
MSVYSDDSNNFLIGFDINSLDMFLIQTAANIILACKTYPHDGSRPAESPIGSELVQRFNWADHGFINALQIQVSVIYDVVKRMVINGEWPLPIRIESAKIFTEALQEYQNLKNAICEKEKEEHGKHWGNATGFFQADWSDQNEKFLELFKA